MAAYAPPADLQTGQIGHYDFRDYAYGSHDGNVDCDYHSYSNGQHRIDEFTFRAPRIWWMDTDASTTHEHGTVGWQYRVQESTDPDTVPFATVKTSSTQKQTAHEDHPGYSDGDKAPFTTRHLSWSEGHTVYSASSTRSTGTRPMDRCSASSATGTTCMTPTSARRRRSGSAPTSCDGALVGRTGCLTRATSRG